MLKNRSGQFVYFSLVSALSGNQVTGASGAISGRKSLDGLSGMILLSGNVIELGGGSYRANLFDFDTNGDQAGYLFTASGCVPVQYQFDMIDGNGSGRMYLSSGQAASLSGVFANVPIASISGAVANSGLFVTVLPSTISGVIANSGLNVTVPIATISGNNSVVPVVTLSGVNTIADVARWRNVVPNTLVSSGRLDAVFNLRTGLTRSGTTTTVQLDAGAPTGLSGVYDGALLTIVGGSGAGESRAVVNYGSSGILTVYPPFVVAPDVDSVYTLTPSRQSLSGLNVTVPISSISGNVGNSGLFVTATASVDPATISGAFVTVPKATISGTNAVVPAASISGVVPDVLSGTVYLASGHQAALYSGQITSPYSGQISKFSFASGVIAHEIPTGVLTKDFNAMGVVASGASGRCLLNATRKLVNKWDMTATSGYLTTYQEDDSTVAMQQAVTATSGATPVTSLDTR
jgi:hypothetical protein